MIKDNVIKNIGDAIIVEITPKANGTLLLKNFKDTFKGLDRVINAGKSNSTFDLSAGDIIYGNGTANSNFDDTVDGGHAPLTIRAVKREFRIVEDGLFATDWLPLNEENLSNNAVPQNAIIQVRYTRIGNDPEGEITFLSIELDGDYTTKVVNTPILDASMFAGVADSPETELIAKNLFKKLYFRGIVPQYIKRAENIDLREDSDYVSLFYSIAKFYALIIQFFKRFENFNNDLELMREWIRQKGIYFDESSITLEELQYFAQNLYSEVARRGTNMIFSHKGDLNSQGEKLSIDGEFIRLIRGSKEYELLYENIPLQNMGWCLGNSSPMYRGLNNTDRDLNKTKNKTADFTSLDNHITFTNGSGKVDIIPFENKKVAKLSTTNNNSSSAGFGRNNQLMDANDYLYVADPLMDYEICFSFYVSQKGSDASLCFGVEGFDGLKNYLPDAFVIPNGDNTTDDFASQIPLNKFINNKWYFVRGIVHAYSSESQKDSKLNIGFGNNLCFNNSFLRYILPKIYIKGSNATVFIWDYKIRPLVRGTNILPLRGDGRENSFSLGFLQSSKIFHAYFRNNNNSQSQREITDIIDKYLLPYDVTEILTFTNKEN